MDEPASARMHLEICIGDVIIFSTLAGNSVSLRRRWLCVSIQGKAYQSQSDEILDDSIRMDVK